MNNSGGDPEDFIDQLHDEIQRITDQERSVDMDLVEPVASERGSDNFDSPEQSSIHWKISEPSLAATGDRHFGEK